MRKQNRSNILRSVTHGWWYSIKTLFIYQKRRFFSLRKDYTKNVYIKKFGRVPDFSKPCTFSEKLCWIKLYDHNPLYTILADKIAVRNYVRERIGEQVLIPCYGVWDKAADISYSTLPDKFVLKCNHESGFVIICRDKATFDFQFARYQLATHLRMNYYYIHKEWHYRDIPPRIIAEKLLMDDNKEDPVNYKIHCFNGVPQFIYVVKNKQGRAAYGFYSPAWNFLPFNIDNVPTEMFSRPKQLENMLNIAVSLSRGLTYCRVDLYALQDCVYFGEITLIPGAGMLSFFPESYDLYWGQRLILPTAK